MVVRMIAMNTLAAFTAEVTRSQGPSQARASAATTSPGAVQPAQPTQRKLEALPAPPSTPMPRGSLLDLRV
jgi:hypothetical protein